MGWLPMLWSFQHCCLDYDDAYRLVTMLADIIILSGSGGKRAASMTIDLSHNPITVEAMTLLQRQQAKARQTIVFALPSRVCFTHLGELDDVIDFSGGDVTSLLDHNCVCVAETALFVKLCLYLSDDDVVCGLGGRRRRCIILQLS